MTDGDRACQPDGDPGDDFEGRDAARSRGDLHDLHDLHDRLRAVERTLTDGAAPAPVDLPDAAAATAERDDLASRLDDVEARVTELEAATQALRGYAGGVRAVNEEVERRADLALATARKARKAREDTALRTENDAGPSTDDAVSPSDDAVPSTDETSPPTDADLEPLLPDEPAVAAAAPRPDGGEGKGSPADAGSDRDPDDSWSDDALARLRDAL